jgi:hypothetical protein
MSNTIIVYYFTPSEDFLGRLAGLSLPLKALSLTEGTEDTVYNYLD